MSKWYETNKKYKRKKCSFYLTESVYNRLEKISQENELSLSQTGERLIVKGYGGMIWLVGLSINSFHSLSSFHSHQLLGKV